MSQPLTSSRLEAFSDGVIAVIITIMVLELKVPAHGKSNIGDLGSVMPMVFVYLLSFVQVGIYWVNHHYLIDGVEQVSHRILWSNLAFLFCLSLFPFATNWVEVRGISSFSIALYATACVLPAIAWTVLELSISRFLRITTVNSRVKRMASTVLNLGAIPAAYVSPYLGLAMIVTVAILWLIPPPKVVEATRALQPMQPPSDSRGRSSL